LTGNMRLFRLLPTLGLLFGARASSFNSREPAPHPLDARDLIDVCASLDTELVVPNLLGILSVVGVLDVCLCISALPLFIKTNVVALLAVDLAGSSEVTNILTALINDAAPNSHCVYPPHSTPICESNDPCGFQCIDGYSPSPAINPRQCICPSPNVICNGKCVPHGACPTNRPANRKRSLVGSGSCTEFGPGWTACGVYGGGRRAWECVDTTHDLESCGGCTLPLTRYSPIGTDCTSLPGVADVACLAGECVVRRCLRGYTLSIHGNGCVPQAKIPTHSHLENEYEYVPASVFGLEHVPLDRREQ